MTPTDKPAFVAVLVGLAAVKPGKGLTPEALEIWWSAMQSWGLDDFRAAASHIARTVEFMPSPFHFEQLRKAGELTSGEAWSLALSGARLEPGSRVARAAQIVGGQQHIRHANIEHDLPHIQRRFIEAYDDLTGVDSTRTALPQIAGERLAQIQSTLIKRLA